MKCITEKLINTQRQAAVACKTLYIDTKENNCINNQSSSLTVPGSRIESRDSRHYLRFYIKKTHNNKLQNKNLILRKEDLRIITHGWKPITVTAKPLIDREVEEQQTIHGIAIPLVRRRKQFTQCTASLPHQKPVRSPGRRCAD